MDLASFVGKLGLGRNLTEMTQKMKTTPKTKMTQNAKTTSEFETTSKNKDDQKEGDKPESHDLIIFDCSCFYFAY